MRYLVLIVFLAASPALGQISLEQALEGFEEFEGDAQIGEIEDVFLPFDEDTETGPAVIEEDLESPAWITISGKLSERLVYNFAHDAPGPGELDHRGISSLRTRLDISTDIEIGQDWRAHASGYSWLDLAPRLRGRDRYPSAYLATYEEETELGEFFLQGSLADNLDLTLGRQVVIWGRSDMFRLTDVLNPLDNRLPGLTDITDLRVPRAMLRLNAYAGDWDISTIVVPDRSLDRGPVIGSDFFSGDPSSPSPDARSFASGTPELAVAATGSFPGWDISFYSADMFDRRPHVAATSRGPVLRHGRFRMIGAAGNIVSGSWLFKGEAAVFSGLRYSNAAEKSFSRTEVLAGVEYYGFPRTSVAFELINRHILNYDDRIGVPPDNRRRNEAASALRISRRFHNDTIEVSLLALTLGLTGKHGAVQRIQLDHDWSDSVKLSTGLVLYKSGDQPSPSFGDNDRFFAGLAYYF